jgi:hypothetical protein
LVVVKVVESCGLCFCWLRVFLVGIQVEGDFLYNLCWKVVEIRRRSGVDLLGLISLSTSGDGHCGGRIWLIRGITERIAGSATTYAEASYWNAAYL